MHLRICHLYPKTLNLYGDRGNILTLKKRCLWRGIEVSLQEIEIGEEGELSSFDLIFMGGGQDSDQILAIVDLKERKEELLEVVEKGVVLLAICGSYQLLGKYYLTEDREIGGLGLFDIHTEAGPKRLIGNTLIRIISFKEEFTLVGFENHSGKTYLGKGAEPLGYVEVGAGNNGEDRTEGCRYKNAFGTYLHGPLLPKNPIFADKILSLALNQRYRGFTLLPLDDTLEDKAHEKALQLAKKKDKG